jgi:hypothetical protein
MSVSWRDVNDPAICAQVLSLYRSLTFTMQQIAERLMITHATVSQILRESMSDEERRRLRGANHSRKKTGEANPMFGRKRAAERILRQGRAAVWNGDGYTFEHRIIAARSLGLDTLPAHLEVHHIDGDKTNNSPDNLAIVTKRGHRFLHKQHLGRLYLWEKEKFGTSLLQEMKATSPKD